MYQIRRGFYDDWFDNAIEWLSSTISPCISDRELKSTRPVKMDTVVCGAPRNPLFDQVIVHYYMVAQEPDRCNAVYAKWCRRCVGTGWNAFQLRHINLDGYQECENLVIIYDELYALQFRLALM